MRKLATALLLAASSLISFAASAAAPATPHDDPTKPVPWAVDGNDAPKPAAPAPLVF
jgi:hypothetical protein